MNVAHPLSPVTPEQFEAMDKDDSLTYELIDGIVLMAPSPSDEHQDVGVRIITTAAVKLKGTPCMPTYERDIKFNNNICRPDVMIKCKDDPNVPIIIFEIVSPTSKRRDYVLKAAIYAESGAAEYWIIDTSAQTVIIHDYVNDDIRVYTQGATIISNALPEFTISLAEIFEELQI